MLGHYDLQGYEIFTEPFESPISQLPELLIMVSPAMKQNYLMFGAAQFAAMDTTFNLIKEKA